MKDLSALKLYTRIARLGSFSAAARAVVDHLAAAFREDEA